MEHEFDLVLDIQSLDNDGFLNISEALFEAGCDDAVFCYQRGEYRLSFGREALSYEQAVESAVAEVRSVGVELVRVDPAP